MKGFVRQQQDIKVSEREGKSWIERLMSWCEMSSRVLHKLQSKEMFNHCNFTMPTVGSLRNLKLISILLNTKSF